MARVGQGEPQIAINESQANITADKFRNYINNPVLTQVKTKFSGFEAYDVEPITVPDVFAERPVIIFGKYKGAAKGSITIKGTAGNKSYSKTFNVSEVKPDSKNAALRYLWARKRIQSLDDYNFLRQDDERIMEVTNLGLKYNLLTNYTSFIAIEEKVVNNGDLTTVDQPLPLPEGVENSAVGFELGVESEESSFEIYKEVAVKAAVTVTSKAKIKKHIETSLMSQLSNYIASMSANDEIEVSLDAAGNVTNIEIKSLSLTKEDKQTISEIILKWKFSQYKVKATWKFQIKF